MTEKINPLDILHKYYREAPVNLNGIANDFGIAVMYADLGRDVSGAIKKDSVFGGSAGYLIIVNDKHHHNRQRFTLAHEIAHFILHKDFIGDGIKDDALYRSNLSNALERQADRLGADILMPWRLINKLKIEYNNDIDKIAEKLQVSKEALRILLS